MKTAIMSDVGRVRSVNEDSSLVDSDVNGFTLAIVADGMGGHQAGDIASQTAVESVRKAMQALQPGMSDEQCKAVLLAAIAEANQIVYDLSSSQELYSGMGTTLVVALAAEEWVIIGHIGDSRAYKYHDGQLDQLTDDHSLVNELVKSGQILPEEAFNHPRRNVVTRALGTEQIAEADILEDHWQQDEVVLMCSDGLSSLISHQEILQILNSPQDLQAKAKSLIDRALAAGGDDNITVILLANDQTERDEEG